MLLTISVMTFKETVLGGLASSFAARDIQAEAVPAHGGADALTALAELAADDLRACDRAIVARMDSPVALIPQLAAHIVAAGGKRVRPLLTLASARLCGYPGLGGGTRHIDLAACVEFIHTATQLHDDVVDESRVRRDPAVAELFGNKAAVLVGDFLFARAFQLMVQDGSLAVLRILSRAAATIAEGEVLQLQTLNNLSTTEDQYLEVVKGKTAALFAAACEVGAVIAARPAREQEALEAYGTNLGIAYQLTDDARAYGLGQSGDDFRDGKVTLPVLSAYRTGDETERAFWRRAIESGIQDATDLDHARRLMAARGAIAETLSRAGVFAHAAQTALLVFPDCGVRQILMNVADQAVTL